MTPPATGRGLRRRELLVATAAIALLAVAIYGRHVLRGGWYYDDWAFVGNLDLAADDGIGSLWTAAADVSYRPGYCVVMLGMYLLGGTGQAPYLAVGLAAAAAQGALLYALLRRLGVAIAVAGTAAAILVVLPVVDAARLWMAAFPSGVALATWLLGVHVALNGLAAGTRRRAVAWHGGALALYLAAMLTSELTVPLVALTPALYALRAGPRAALPRLPADLALAAAAVTYLAGAVTTRRPVEGSLSHFADRAAQIWTAGTPIVEDQVPLDRLLWGPVGLLVLAVAAAGIALLLARRRSVAEIRREALMAAAGAAFTLAGLVMLLPADAYFVPRPSGVGDRVTIAAAPGFACLLAGLLALVARGLAAPVRAPAARLAVFAAAVALTVGPMIRDELRVQDTWAASWAQSQAVVGAVKRALPDAPRGAAIITVGHATSLQPQDVPVFTAGWDLRGALRLTYRDPTLAAQPYTTGPTTCEPDGLHLFEATVPYGRAFLVDATSDTAHELTSRQACRAAFAAYGG